MRIAIDWSHTKDLATYDGKKVRIETLKQLLSRIAKDGGESKRLIESNLLFQPPSAILEQGCPMGLIYNLVKAGMQVSLIDNKSTENYRQDHDIEKTDKTDARIIWELSQNGAKLQPVSIDDKLIQLHDIYHQYCRYQKARVAMENMRKAHQRQYKVGASIDLSPYDIAIDSLGVREKSLLKKLEFDIQPPVIKGLGKRIWVGLMTTANPVNFNCLSAYLRFCGLTGDAIKSHRYNRHARFLYHMLADEVMKNRDEKFRPIYDKCKVDIAEKYPGYTKGHIHSAALNRTATLLAKEIFRCLK